MDSPLLARIIARESCELHMCTLSVDLWKVAKLEESFLRFIKDRFRHSMVSFLENECFSQESVLSQQRIIADGFDESEIGEESKNFVILFLEIRGFEVTFDLLFNLLFSWKRVLCFPTNPCVCLERDEAQAIKRKAS